MQVDTEAQVSCGACERTIDPTQRVGRTKARWYKYTDPSSGFYEWGQICAPCLHTQWRSMTRSWDETTMDASDCTHDIWKKGLFDKVVRLRLRSPPTAVIDPHDPRNEPDNYELKAPVVPDKFDYEE